MIHINDIKDRLARNPEPIEVTKMRENILSKFKNLQFFEDGHRYQLVNDKGEVILNNIPSVSGIIRRFENQIDWDEKAETYAIKHGRTKEDVQRQWKETNIKATNSGSHVHLYGESMMKWVTDGSEDFDAAVKIQYEDGFLIPHSPKEEAVVRYWKDIMAIDEMYPLIPECKLYMPENNIYGIDEIFCGTADITFAYKYRGEWSIILMDYKTNKGLYSNYNMNNDVTMLPPFDNMIDQAFDHYVMQLTLYSMMLENLGYKVIDRQIIWLKDDKSYEKIKLPYIKDKIIESFKKN